MNDDPPLCWPRTVRSSAAAPQRLVYLDLCHWIYLAKAAKGVAAGAPYQKALTRCREAVRDKQALFVLSPELYTEPAKIKDPKQRQDVAAVMGELSGYATLPPRSALLEREIDASLTQLFGAGINTPAPMSLVGIGFGHAFAVPGKFVVRGPRGDASAELRARMGAARFEALMSHIQAEAEHRMLAGPDDSDVAQLRKNGWSPESLETKQQERAGFERDLQAWLIQNPERFGKQSELYTLVAAREMMVGFFDQLVPQLAQRGLGPSVLDSDLARLSNFVLSMPSARVATVLKTRLHSNRAKRWSSNDIYDIDAISLATPYCDIVVPDKEYANVLQQAHLDKAMRTAVLRNLNQLITELNTPRVPQRRQEPDPL
ncbi:hypothetical protein ACWCQE_37340 [Streptomyces sp. NPDC002409]